ncbi:metallophosphoesterase [Microbacterium sp.]|uniref:metallophosphoesterase n=1 Tax=Microbacterium sp. TaxID=51671 RepID=UPI0037C60ED6
MRIAILSDVHAGEAPHGDTWVITEPPSSPANENPLRDLAGFVRENHLEADLLLCPGDLGNRAHEPGRLYGWNALHHLRGAFGANSVVATVGNHDVVTRKPSPDQAQFLKMLTPSFPTDDPILVAQYWAEGFYVDDRDPGYRILNINTCADFPSHPGPAASQDDVDAPAACRARLDLRRPSGEDRGRTART